jgi:hypothetical protein
MKKTIVLNFLLIALIFLAGCSQKSTQTQSAQPDNETAEQQEAIQQTKPEQTEVETPKSLEITQQVSNTPSEENGWNLLSVAGPDGFSFLYPSTWENNNKNIVKSPDYDSETTGARFFFIPLEAGLENLTQEIETSPIILDDCRGTNNVYKDSEGKTNAFIVNCLRKEKEFIFLFEFIEDTKTDNSKYITVFDKIVESFKFNKETDLSTQEFDINKFISENPDYSGCKKVVFCNDLVRIDCGVEVDGPEYFLNKNTGALISTCGGACFKPLGEQLQVCQTLCPPKEWTCK